MLRVSTTTGKKNTAGFVLHHGNYGSCVPIPVAGTVSVGLGTVWENPTLGLPVSSPSDVNHA